MGVGTLEFIDTVALIWMNDLRHPVVTVGMATVTWMGSAWLLVPLAFVVGWKYGTNLHNRVFMPAAVLGATFIAHALKWFIDRDRPALFPSLIQIPVDASFPSAHAMQISAFVTAWLYFTNGWRHLWKVIVGAMIVGTISLSRLYLQVHFLTDVLLGMLGGLLWVWLLYRLPLWTKTSCATNF